jgi:hypothetical protein
VDTDERSPWPITIIGVAAAAALVLSLGIFSFPLAGLLGSLDRDTAVAVDATAGSTVILHLPPTEGAIILRGPVERLEFVESPLYDVVARAGEDVGDTATIEIHRCARGCTVRATALDAVVAELEITYAAGDSEYVDDIEIEVLP